MTELHPLLGLGRRFVVDWLNAADPGVPAEIFSPGYLVHIGGIELDGLASYLAGTLGQLAQFPGLGLTVHDVVTDGERLGLVFTEHGASARHELRTAAWRGVALFRSAGGRLAENWTQEDYYSRRRQLTSGRPDPVPPPAIAPWTTVPVPGQPAAEAAARAWLAAPDLAAVQLDDGGPGVDFEVGEVGIAELFSAGPRVAFAASWTGRYRGGIDGLPAGAGPRRLGCAGLLTVTGGSVTGGTVVTDRLGLRRALLG